ncbi:MAG: capsular biosynthesis protein [Pseudomonadota bacterium]
MDAKAELCEATTGEGRVVLMLQGPSSFFFIKLARALRAEGAEVLRVALCPGDQLYWRRRHGPILAYRGRAGDWPAYLRSVLARFGVTDLLCLGDGRESHRAAVEVARAAGVRVHIMEQGYLRPGWLTIEPDGTGGRSRLPRDAATIRALAAQVAPRRTRPFQTSFLEYSVLDVGWNLANLLGAPVLFPHYRTHALDPPLREWSGWIGKAVRLPGRRAALRRAEARIAGHEGPLYLFPLQLETDFQIRQHGPEEGLRETLQRVIASFAAHAPADAMLAVKLHPLDNGWAPWEALVASGARQSGVAERVVYLDGGDLDAMLGRARGVVTVNSTVGLTAVQQGVPVKVLGRAIYDVEGMTDPRPLDAFWPEPQRPEMDLVADFVRLLTGTIQVPGHCDGEGTEPGAEAMAAALLAPPPRLTLA